MSSKVVGVDLSLTGTGLASITRHHGASTLPGWTEVHTQVVRTKADDNTLHSRYDRLEGIATKVIHYCQDAGLVVIEGPSYSSGGRGTWDRAGLWWWCVSILELTGVPVMEVAPNVRRKWATNNGQASKAAVAVAVGRMWPEVTTEDDNDADALALAGIGAQLVCMEDVPERAYQKAIVDKLALPTEVGTLL